MKLLLDTHIFLWFISGDGRLPAGVRSAIQSFDNEVFLSVVSLWEATVKYQLGKLPLPQPPNVYLPLQRERHQIMSLALAESAVLELAVLPPHHRDPFDRMLICQALAHQCTVVTGDPAIHRYAVSVLSGT